MAAGISPCTRRASFTSSDPSPCTVTVMGKPVDDRAVPRVPNWAAETLSITIWYWRIGVNVVGSASRLSNCPGSRAANASLVGAKNVSGPGCSSAVATPEVVSAVASDSSPAVLLITCIIVPALASVITLVAVVTWAAVATGVETGAVAVMPVPGVAVGSAAPVPAVSSPVSVVPVVPVSVPAPEISPLVSVTVAPSVTVVTVVVRTVVVLVTVPVVPVSAPALAAPSAPLAVSPVVSPVVPPVVVTPSVALPAVPVSAPAAGAASVVGGSAAGVIVQAPSNRLPANSSAVVSPAAVLKVFAP